MCALKPAAAHLCEDDVASRASENERRRVLAASNGGVKEVRPLPTMKAQSHRTLDLEHTSVLKRLGNERSHAEALREEHAQLEARIRRLERLPRDELTDADYDDLKRFRYRQDRVRQEAEEAEQRGDEIGYFVRTAGILFKYYDIIEKGPSASASASAGPGIGSDAGIIGSDASMGGGADAGTVRRHTAPHQPQRAGGGGDCPTASDCGGVCKEAACAAATAAATAAAAAFQGGATKARSILSYFRPSPPNAPQSGTTADCRVGHESGAIPCVGEETFRPGTQHHNATTDDRATLFDRYLQSIDGDGPVCYTSSSPCHDGASSDANNVNPVSSFARSACEYCGSHDRAVQLQEGYVFCNMCRTVEYIIVDHEKPSYKDPPKEVAYFAYKRINHFNEWLNQVQGKETTEISEDVYDSILLEIKKQKLSNMAMLTRRKVKEILKKLRINKYYEHIPHIINRLNGMPSPHFPADLEDRLRYMFCQIQVPFLKHAPPARKNFLSYSYCLNKMMQLLEKDQYLDSFPLLKSREKLHQQDVIWQKICEEIGWDFIPSL